MKNFPAHLKDEFISFMQAHDHPELPDGAWFQCLEDGAGEFLKLHKELKFDANDLAHIYFKETSEL